MWSALRDVAFRARHAATNGTAVFPQSTPQRGIWVVSRTAATGWQLAVAGLQFWGLCGIAASDCTAPVRQAMHRVMLPSGLGVQLHC